MSARLLYLAKHSAAAVPAPPSGDVARAMLSALLPPEPSATALLAHAARLLQRCLGFDMSGAYVVEPEQRRLLQLVASDGLPPEFGEVAGRIPLSDFGEISDLPYNGDHAGCTGDFFAPVIGAFGGRAWMIASFPDPANGAIRGAILLGSRDPKRFGPDDSRLIFSLKETVSELFFSAVQREQELEPGTKVA